MGEPWEIICYSTSQPPPSYSTPASDCCYFRIPPGKSKGEIPGLSTGMNLVDKCLISTLPDHVFPGCPCNLLYSHNSLFLTWALLASTSMEVVQSLEARQRQCRSKGKVYEFPQSNAEQIFFFCFLLPSDSEWFVTCEINSHTKKHILKPHYNV